MLSVKIIAWICSVLGWVWCPTKNMLCTWGHGTYVIPKGVLCRCGSGAPPQVRGVLAGMVWCQHLRHIHNGRSRDRLKFTRVVTGCQGDRTTQWLSTQRRRLPDVSLQCDRVMAWCLQRLAGLHSTLHRLCQQDTWRAGHSWERVDIVSDTDDTWWTVTWHKWRLLQHSGCL